MQILRLMMLLVALLLPVSALAVTKTQVDTDSVQSLSNKTLAAPIMTLKMNVPLVTAFPSIPSPGDMVVITTDSTTGACDGLAGTATTLCLYTGSRWLPLGDGAASGSSWPANSTLKEVTWANAFTVAAMIGDGTNKIAFFSDASMGPTIECSVAGVENDCDYIRKLNPGKKGGWRDRNGTDIFTLTESVGVGVLTNVTLDVEGTGNTITTSSKINIAPVGCAGTAGFLLVDTNATLAPSSTCTAGATNTTLIQGYADFPDLDGDYGFQTSAFRLPSDWNGAIDLQLFWKAAATSGDVVWQVATMCTADGEIEDVAWNTADAFAADTAKGTTLQLNAVSKTGITTTGCSPGELMHLKIFRNRTNGSDTITGVVSLKNAELTLRRAQ